MPDQAVDVSSLVALREMQPPGRPDGVGRIVSRFLEESASRLSAIRQAVGTGDARELEQAAHALKGISGTVGAKQMERIAVRLEELGREGHTSGAEVLVDQLDGAFAHARPIFDRLRNPE